MSTAANGFATDYATGSMTRPARLARLAGLALAAAGLGLGGCVNQGSYDSLYEANRALEARNTELSEAMRALQAENNALSSRLGSGDSAVGAAQRSNAELQAQLAEMQRRYRELEERLGGLQFGPLDAATDAVLQDLAARFPNILTYDAARGMLRFTSDVTFASGSFELTGPGQQTVAELARVLLQTPAAGQYDIYVVGHTDTQRVRQVAGRRFLNNDELSAFRAISVANAMTNAGMRREKVMFAGFGESRPVIDRGPNANVPQNRRVEVFLARGGSTGSEGGSRGASAAPSPAPAPAGNNPDVMK